jgi:hypothetical protein
VKPAPLATANGWALTLPAGPRFGATPGCGTQVGDLRIHFCLVHGVDSKIAARPPGALLFAMQHSVYFSSMPIQCADRLIWSVTSI